MSFYVQRTTGLIDEISDAETVADRVPRYAERFEALLEVRRANDGMFEYSSWGRRHVAQGHRRVASIPEAVMSRIMEIEPDFLISKAKFYAWLDKHPEYQTIRRTSD